MKAIPLLVALVLAGCQDVGGMEAPAVAPQVSGTWPDNEPAGLVPVFPGHPTIPGVLLDGSEHRFDYTAQGGSNLGSNHFFGRKWDGGPRILSTTSAGSKYSNVIRKNMLIGDRSGWNGNASLTNFGANYETLYMRMVFRYSDNWQFHSATDKLWMWGEASSSPNDFFVGVTSGSKVLALINQSGSGDSGEWRSRQIVTRGEWHTLEVIQTAQSALGVADGSFQMFYDGVEITDFNWLKRTIPDPGQNAIEWYGSGHTTRLFSGVELALYWGGSGPPKTVNDHIDIGEFYITGREAAS